MTSPKEMHLGQHLFIGLPGTKLDDNTRRMFDTVRPGGIVLFARNIDNATELRALTRTLRTELGLSSAHCG